MRCTSFLITAMMWIQICVCYESFSHKLLEKISSVKTNRLILDPEDQNSHFTRFNKTRVPSSRGSDEIQKYIVSHFENLNKNSPARWDIALDKFEEKNLNFTNIVLTKSPPEVSRFLVIAAHYDSLINIEGFIGAIDSAVSCGILLDIAEVLSPWMDTTFTNEDYDLDVGLKIVFFDGEEALESWSATDSIYGARHLHQQWANDGTLSEIELFILLDLLGSQSTKTNYVPSFFPQTHEFYTELSSLETRLINVAPSLFPSLNDKFLAHTNDGVFRVTYNGYIEDDHIPFLRSNVPILHLIPASFPPQWHKIEDDFSLVDPVAANRWNVLLRTFIAQYLELQV